MTGTLAPILLGLAASLSWGSGDFFGGIASRRAKAMSVVALAYTTGFFLLIALALLWREPLPTSGDVLWSVLAGLAGASGLIAFYSALAIGQMGIIAPISAVLSAAIPVLFSTFTQGPPAPLRIGGFLLALLAIALISRPQRSAGRPDGLWLALLAGCGFGVFFVLISRVQPTSTFWPLAVARLSSVTFLFIISGIRRESLKPTRGMMRYMLLSGMLDAIGNAFFVLAAHSGRLDIASILSSLYPAATVILAALILHERINRVQAVGVGLALVAIALISLP
jgi:drug/metabolite transporter (DMT)-like permease